MLIPDFIKIHPVVQELNHMDRQTGWALRVNFLHTVQTTHNNYCHKNIHTTELKHAAWNYFETGTYTACSSSSLPICRDTVLSVPTESLIISSCSSWVLRMWFCCWSVSSRNCRFGLSNSFSSLEYLVVPWLVGTRTGLFSRSGYRQNIFDVRLTTAQQTYAPIQSLYVPYFISYKLYW